MFAKKNLAFSVHPQLAKNFGQSAKKTHFCVQSYKRKRANKFCWPATFFYKLKFQILLIIIVGLFCFNPKFVKKGGKLTYLGKVGEGSGGTPPPCTSPYRATPYGPSYTGQVHSPPQTKPPPFFLKGQKNWMRSGWLDWKKVSL